MRRGSHGPQLGLIVVAIVALAGCNGGDSVVEQTPAAPTSAAPPPSSPASTPVTATPTPTTTTSAQEAAILKQYRAYFETRDPAQRLTSMAVRDATMRKVAVDPELAATLNSMTAATAVGEVFYGRVLLRPKLSFVKGKYARLTDCQDTSGYGRQKLSGAKVTKGRANVLATSTMVLGDDGIWRLGALAYDRTGATCAA